MNVIVHYGSGGSSMGMAIFVADGLTRSGHTCSLEYDVQAGDGVLIRLGRNGITPTEDELGELLDRGNDLVDIYRDAVSEPTTFQP